MAGWSWLLRGTKRAASGGDHPQGLDQTCGGGERLDRAWQTPPPAPVELDPKGENGVLVCVNLERDGRKRENTK